MTNARQNWKTAYRQARKQIKGATGIYGADLPWYGSCDEQKTFVNGVHVRFDEYRGTIEIMRSGASHNEGSFNRLLAFSELRLWKEYQDPEEFSPANARRYFQVSRNEGFKLP